MADSSNVNGVIYDPDRGLLYYTDYGAGLVRAIEIVHAFAEALDIEGPTEAHYVAEAAKRKLLDRLFACHMDDVKARTGHAGHRNRPAGCFCFSHGWMSRGMIFWLYLSFRQQLVGEFSDDVTIFGMDHDDHAVLSSDIHRSKQRRIIDLEDILVGHE